MRPTSVEAYHKAEESGLLSKLRLKVFKILCDHGPMTANEMRMFGDSNANSGVYSTRLSELERMKIVAATSERACKTTGNKALLWDITNNHPIKLDKRETKKVKTKRAVDALRVLYLKYKSFDTEWTNVANLIKNI